MTAIYAIGLAFVLPFTFVQEARAFNEPDLLSIQIRATAKRVRVLIKFSSLYQTSTGYESELS